MPRIEADFLRGCRSTERHLAEETDMSYCTPWNAGLASAAPAVARRLGRLLTALDTEVTGHVCEGDILSGVNALKRDMLLSLRAEGWRVDWIDHTGKWRVLPPPRKRG